MKTDFFNLSAARVALLLSIIAPATLLPAAPRFSESARTAIWVDALRGEPLSFDELLGELQSTRIVYLGEVHSIFRHHELQTQILRALADRGTNMVLAMEQFEFTAQPALDRFNSGQLDLPALIRECNWDKRWPSHTNYHALLQIARQRRFPVLALNARTETIRKIGRNGLGGLSPEDQREVPQFILPDDPLYERLLNRTLGVHMAFDPAKLRPVFEAQVARDETMASRLTAFLNSPAGQGRLAVVICGRGHCEFGLGTPDRVARRIPGISQRSVLFSESGDLELSLEERKQARDVEMPHQFLRDLGRAPADFLHIIQPAAPAP